MHLPSAHLGRVSLPAALELPQAEGIVLVSGFVSGRLRVIDPREGESWIELGELQQAERDLSCRYFQS